MFSCLNLFSASANDSAKTKAELEQIKQQINQLQKKLESSRKRYGSAAKSLQNTEQRINSAAKILRATQRQIKREQQKLNAGQQEQKQLEHDKERHQQLLGKQLQSAYSNGQQEYLKLLLNQEDPSKLGRILAYYKYLTAARTESIKELGTTLVRLQQVQKEIEQSIKELSVLETSQKEEQQRLLSLKEKRAVEVDKLAKSIASQDKKILSLREDEEELEALLQTMQKALESMVQAQNLSGLSKMKGQLSWPIRGKITQKFGQTISRDLKSNGVRIEAKEGQDIASVFHGRVIFSDWLRGFGLLIIVDHGEGYMSLYGNNQSLFKDVGDWVEAGELIATAGQSGGQKSPGLYFEIREQGKAHNPLSWIKRS